MKRIAVTAARLIAKYGRKMSLREKEPQGDEYNPTFFDLDTEIMGVEISFTADEIVQANDKNILIAGAASLQMKLVDGDVEYEIVGVNSVQPGDTLILSELHVRR